MGDTNWKDMPHELPEEMQGYLMLLCEAGNADNELKLLTRYQKILRKIHDEHKQDVVRYGNIKIERAAVRARIAQLEDKDVFKAVLTLKENEYE